MSATYRTENAKVISVLRAQVEIIQEKELPMALSKVEVCKQAGWTWLESYFQSYANGLQRELSHMQEIIDWRIDENAAR